MGTLFVYCVARCCFFTSWFLLVALIFGFNRSLAAAISFGLKSLRDESIPLLNDLKMINYILHAYLLMICLGRIEYFLKATNTQLIHTSQVG